jgi:hypothetical protein
MKGRQVHRTGKTDRRNNIPDEGRVAIPILSSSDSTTWAKTHSTPGPAGAMSGYGDISTVTHSSSHLRGKNKPQAAGITSECRPTGNYSIQDPISTDKHPWARCPPLSDATLTAKVTKLAKFAYLEKYCCFPRYLCKINRVGKRFAQRTSRVPEL